MGFRRAGRIEALDVSEIVRLTETAAQMRSAGIGIAALSTGEPDFPTPDHVVAAANQAALAGRTRYTATRGTPELRDIVATACGGGSDEVIISTGAKQVLANAMLATLDPGDEVIVPAPWWTSYPDIVTMAGGRPITVPCPLEQGFKLTADQLRAAITDRTRWLILNTPSNPSGAVYSAAELAALADVLDDFPHVWVLADEIYQHISFVPFASVREAAGRLAERMLVVNGVSKAYSMTGWRVGWGIGPKSLIDAMTAVQGQITSGASSVSQAAAVAALTGDQTLLDERRDVMRNRRDRVVARLNAIAGVNCPVPEGAIYAFPNIEAALDRLGIASDAELCQALLETAHVAVVPGRAFGSPGHLRLSFAYSDDDLDKGLTRLARFIGEQAHAG